MKTAQAPVVQASQDIIQNGDIFQLYQEQPGDVTPQLPPATYILRLSKTGYYFERIKNFTMPPKIYGDDITEKTNRIITTYQDRKNNTAILAVGEKGSGKTLLAKHIANEMIRRGHPVINIDKESLIGNFYQFIGQFQTPSVIFIDEFEKTFDGEAQELMLSLLDGTSVSKHLFVLTSNSSQINTNMINRPGRIYYIFNYSSLDNDTTNGYINDNLKNKEFLEETLFVCKMFTSLNFDMMQTIVEEVNRYNISPRKLMKHLNASPLVEHSSFKVELEWNGKKILTMFDTVNKSPYLSGSYVSVEISNEDKKVKDSIKKIADAGEEQGLDMDELGYYGRIIFHQQHFTGFEENKQIFERKIKINNKQHTFVMKLTPYKIHHHEFTF